MRAIIGSIIFPLMTQCSREHMNNHISTMYECACVRHDRNLSCHLTECISEQNTFMYCCKCK